MRKFLQRILTRPVIRLSEKFGSRPKKERVFEALSNLYRSISTEPGKKGPILELSAGDRLIIFSDQHKGARNYADDFMSSEKNYLAALKYYNELGYTLIALGDSEELWENLLTDVKKHNRAAFEAEGWFHDRQAFVKIFGNHDLYWDNDPLAGYQLKEIYGNNVRIFEGCLVRIAGQAIDIFLTHGHQGDLQSDGNWFSKWFVSTIWAPLQAFLRINPNTPAYDNALKSIHNEIMYNWSQEQDKLILITGHTHQPVFNSLTYLERIYHQLENAITTGNTKKADKLRNALTDRISKGETAPIFKAYKPSYFNTGCCCFSDGDITGIEIGDGKINLVKWEYDADETPERILLEEERLENLVSRC